MTPSAQCRVGGSGALLAFSGESLTYLNGKVQALVNRNIVRGKDFFKQFHDGAIDFDVLNLSEIEIQKSDLPTRPQASETFIDSDNVRHRIRLVTQTDISWMCFCTPSRVT